MDMSSALFSDFLTCPVCREILPDDFAQSECRHLHCMACLKSSKWRCTVCRAVDENAKATPFITELLKAYPRTAECGAIFYGLALTHSESCILCWKVKFENVQEEFVTLREHANIMDTKYHDEKEEHGIARDENMRLNEELGLANEKLRVAKGDLKRTKAKLKRTEDELEGMKDAKEDDSDEVQLV